MDYISPMDASTPFAQILPHVAILVDTSTGWGRRLIQGVTNYAVKHGPWRLWVEPHGRSEIRCPPQGWRGDGIIARVHTQQLAKQLIDIKLPVINVSSIQLKNAEFPRITSNFEAQAQLAVEHFIERGYLHFAYIGPLGKRYVRSHGQVFEQVVAQRGGSCQTFDYRNLTIGSAKWREQEKRVAEWLIMLPKPVGVYSWETSAGAKTIDLCRAMNIIVPDEVAVLCCDEDPLLCETTTPSMSGIVTASEQIGFQAAELLDKTMRNPQNRSKKSKPVHISFDPLTIVARGSTEALAINDVELRKAVIYMRQHACQQVTVEQIAHELNITRRSLERKFKDHFGRSPLQEIKRLRLARIKELLVHTDMPIADIATATGFGTLEYLSTTFKEAVGQTPLRYRSLTRGR